MHDAQQRLGLLVALLHLLALAAADIDKPDFDTKQAANFLLGRLQLIKFVTS